MHRFWPFSKRRSPCSEGPRRPAAKILFAIFDVLAAAGDVGTAQFHSPDLARDNLGQFGELDAADAFLRRQTFEREREEGAG